MFYFPQYRGLLVGWLIFLGWVLSFNHRPENQRSDLAVGLTVTRQWCAIGITYIPGIAVREAQN